jgi:hypothetical protein
MLMIDGAGAASHCLGCRNSFYPQYGAAASRQLNHFGDGCILWRTFIPGWPGLYMAWKRQLGPMMI